MICAGFSYILTARSAKIRVRALPLLYASRYIYNDNIYVHYVDRYVLFMPSSLPQHIRFENLSSDPMLLGLSKFILYASRISSCCNLRGSSPPNRLFSTLIVMQCCCCYYHHALHDLKRFAERTFP